MDAVGDAGRRSVIVRGLTLLEAFTALRPELTLSELARRSGLPTSTAHRLAADLLTWGALERTPEGRLRIGLRLWEVGTLASRGYGLRRAALPVMEDLFAVVRGHVQLAVLDDGTSGPQALTIERLSAPEARPIAARVGGRLPLHASGAGQVLLAHAPVDLAEEVLRAPLRRYTPRTVTDPHQLRRTLAEIRHTGVAITRGTLGSGVDSVAAAVRDPSGAVVAALSVVVVDTAVELPPLVPAVRTAALGVSRGLAAPPPPVIEYPLH